MKNLAQCMYIYEGQIGRLNFEQYFNNRYFCNYYIFRHYYDCGLLLFPKKRS